MIKLLLLPHHQKTLLITSPVIQREFGGIDETDLITSRSGKIIGYFPDLPILSKDFKPNKLLLNNRNNEMRVDNRDILVSSQNIHFRFKKKDLRKIFEVITFATLHIESLTKEQYDEVNWIIKDSYIDEFINNLTLNQKMLLTETFFHTSDPILKARLRLLTSPFDAPIITNDFDVFTFREHQQRGINFIKKNQQKNRLSILDYDMGAGKTRMILSLFKNVQGNTISVVKSSLISGLIAEAKELGIFRELNLFFIYNQDSLAAYRDRYQNVVITYETLSRYEGNYKEPFWDNIFDYLITDESQILQNHLSKVFNAFINISAIRGAFFSGTLIRNSVGDTYYLSYWSKIFTANGNTYHSKMKAQAGKRKLYAMNVNSEFAMKVKKIILGMTISYKNDFKFEIKEYDIPVKLREDELAYYKLELEEAYRIIEILRKDKMVKVKEDARPLFSLMDVISKIPRMIAISSNHRLRETLYQPKGSAINIYDSPTKYKVLKAILNKYSDKKILIFVALKNVGISYSKMLKKEGYKNMYFDGSIDKDIRFANVQKFNQDSCSKNIFIATRDSMKYGLNFSNTSIVINLDRSWTPADNEQANARIKRLSQKNKKIKIFNIFSVDTIDEYMKTVNHLKNNAINDFWDKNSDYNAIADYSVTYTSLFEMIDNLKEGIVPNKKSKLRPLRVLQNDISYDDLEIFF